jgi:hypothetical protein
MLPHSRFTMLSDTFWDRLDARQPIRGLVQLRQSRQAITLLVFLQI